ncbi:hypothetical protein KBI52_08745 [Microvirga sp. HBU67558]|uniref:hypothetical protein n=1 Tax=Microvirga TaxID=186650 RepID=UPI001B367BB8|nr:MULTISPECIES: hypothetical protein [unclassified Microvirga]MBQ0820297.1 hypothetical protein [Microvirga sp. HBU67558]
MPSLDLMTERELLAHLHQLAVECDGLDHRIALAAHRQRFAQTSRDAEQAAGDEQTLLTELSRLMDRMRATEGHLRRVRGQLRPLQPHDTLVG